MNFKCTLYILCIYAVSCYDHHGFDTITDYASLPALFHMDNFDECMLLEHKAFYCTFSCKLEPVNADESSSQIWNKLKELQENPYCYRHDILRHGICVPNTCPSVTKTHDNNLQLYSGLINCYNKKFEYVGLKTNITNIQCDTNDPKYPIDWWDITFACGFIFYILIILSATLYERTFKNQTSADIEARIRRVSEAISIRRNWIRLTTIPTGPDVEKLRCIQGVRFYTMFLVILTHTIYILFISLPVLNVREMETLTEKFAAIFLTSGPLCVSTYFMISSLLIYGAFELLKNQEIPFRTIVMIFINRYVRLTYSLAIIVAFQTTWLRHCGSGPYWNNIAGKEFLNCRQNGWTNIFYINNLVNSEDMCLQTTWYLALGVQYFVLTLLLLWFIKNNQLYTWLILGSVLFISIVTTFIRNYLNDFSAVMIPTPESLYDMKHTLKNKQWQIQYIGFFENISGPIVGLGVGNLYYKYKNQRMFNTKFRVWMWWIITHGLGYGTVIIPGFLSLSKSVPHDTFWASVSAAISRPLFVTAIGFGLIGLSQGVGGTVKQILEWRPLYVLGRLTYAAYLVHIPILLIRASMIRSPVYINEYSIFFELVGALGMSYVVATIFTLLFEMPVTELQKIVTEKYKLYLIKKIQRKEKK